MKRHSADKRKFKFTYLPDYAKYLLESKLEEFVTVGIRFCREEGLPMLKPLARIPEKDLVALSMDSNRQILEALIDGSIYTFIEKNMEDWMHNKIAVLDKADIMAEDLTLAYYIRRKLFSHFLYGYTQNPSIQVSIISEVDNYTTQEELIALKTYLQIQKDIRAA